MDTAKIPGPCSDQEAGTKNGPCIQHTFLFVNESTPIRGFKAGRRPGVQSHIRKHVLKNYKKGQMRSQQKATQMQRLSPLAPLQVRSADGRLGDTQELSERGLLDADLGSEDFSGLSTSEKTQLEFKTSDCTFNLSPERDPSCSGNHVSSPLDFLQHSPQAEQSQTYCLHCGTSNSSNNTELSEYYQSLIQRKHKSSDLCSPVELLGSGRVDPFLSYPIENIDRPVHELMDHAITYMLPGIFPDGSNGPVHPIAKTWFVASLTYPFLFHALVFAGSIHLDFMRYSTIYPNSPVVLSHKLIIIQQLNNILSNPKEASRDEVILAILILATHEARAESEVRVKPFESPLMSAQWLNVYGNIQYVPEHMMAVLRLIAMRGGLGNLNLHGLAEIIVAGDIIAASNNLSKPLFPPLPSVGPWIEQLTTWAKAPIHFPIQHLGRGFLNLQKYGLTPEAIYIFDAMASTTVAIAHYLRGKPGGLTLGQIAKARTVVHQRLLLLPSFSELEGVQDNPSVYEACRNTASIYAIAVIFPIPNSFHPFQTLVKRLKSCIESGGVEKEACLSNLLLWVLVIGGIAALDKPEREWYVSKLILLIRRWGAWEWESVERNMGEYLWLESACGLAGRRLWAEVMNRTLEEMSGIC